MYGADDDGSDNTRPHLAIRCVLVSYARCCNLGMERETPSLDFTLSAPLALVLQQSRLLHVILLSAPRSSGLQYLAPVKNVHANCILYTSHAYIAV